MVAREFENPPVGIPYVGRAAIAVLQNEGVWRLDARSGNALLDGGLRRRVHRERNVMKQRCRHFRSEFLLVRRVFELEKGERATICHTEEGVAVGAHLTK